MKRHEHARVLVAEDRRRRARAGAAHPAAAPATMHRRRATARRRCGRCTTCGPTRIPRRRCPTRRLPAPGAHTRPVRTSRAMLTALDTEMDKVRVARRRRRLRHEALRPRRGCSRGSTRCCCGPQAHRAPEGTRTPAAGRLRPAHRRGRRQELKRNPAEFRLLTAFVPPAVQVPVLTTSSSSSCGRRLRDVADQVSSPSATSAQRARPTDADRSRRCGGFGIATTLHVRRRTTPDPTDGGVIPSRTAVVSTNLLVAGFRPGDVGRRRKLVAGV